MQSNSKALQLNCITNPIMGIFPTRTMKYAFYTHTHTPLTLHGKTSPLTDRQNDVHTCTDTVNIFCTLWTASGYTNDPHPQTAIHRHQSLHSPCHLILNLLHKASPAFHTTLLIITHQTNPNVHTKASPEQKISDAHTILQKTGPSIMGAPSVL